jgi:exopolyphosphatase / guanosine-5'-triphosphate,3'-diphosphate pyrophosphatase
MRHFSGSSVTSKTMVATMRAVRLAAIDVGSNSVHMVVADLHGDGRIEVVDRVKEMVRLGRRTFTTGRLPAEGADLAVRAVKTFSRLARARRVERIRAVATSAVREARNGAAFVHRLREETGLPVKVISGAEEARLIFRAAHHALGLAGGPHLLLDVGGGSVELVLVHEGKPLWLRSLPLGAARLTERFLPSDPPTMRQVQRLEKHLAREIGGLLVSARHAGVLRAVGTSGTVNGLVAMARAARGDEVGRLHGSSATAAEIARLRRRLLSLPASKRAELPGIDAKRVDLMPAAGVLADFVLSRSGAPALVACGWALREGVLLELAGAPQAARGDTQRRRSVEALAQRFAGANRHGRQVARLGLMLFDGVGEALTLPAGARELVEYAALLHDIGHAIDHDRHQHHSCYLVRNAELVGFDRLEVEIVAQAVRGHRKQMPKLGDPELRVLTGTVRHTVRGLAAILRLADALDRTHFGVVRGLEVAVTAHRVTIDVEAGENPELELWAAERRVDLLSRILDRHIVLRCRGAAARPIRLRAGAR